MKHLRPHGRTAHPKRTRRFGFVPSGLLHRLREQEPVHLLQHLPADILHRPLLRFGKELRNITSDGLVGGSFEPGARARLLDNREANRMLPGQQQSAVQRILQLADVTGVP